jgi:CRP/FNR family cyclic AMP-dependent transcriptional regulator
MVGWFRFMRREDGAILHPDTSMRAPYGLEVIESCLTCQHRQDRLFCNLSMPAVEQLSGITSSAVYPKGAMLFVEGQAPRGVLILCNGRVKLSTSSVDGRTLILRVPESGEVLGLPATVTGKPYELTAEVIEPTQANFIARNDFLIFLRDRGEAAVRVAQMLGETYHSAVSGMRSIGLSHSAHEKVARFLLDLCAEVNEVDQQTRLTSTLTHEEIAQIVGASRETVTRIFSQFKKKQFMQIKGSTIIISNKAALQDLVDGKPI